MGQKSFHFGMALGAPPALTNWWNNLSLAEQTEVRQHLGHLVSLMEVEPCREMIEASVSFWDERFNVFRFGDIKMTPLLEEIGGFVSNSGLKRHQWQARHMLAPSMPTPDEFRKKLGLMKNIDLGFLQQQKIPFSYFHNRFGYTPIVEEYKKEFASYEDWKRGRPFAFAIYFLGIIVFPENSEHNISPRLVMVTDALFKGIDDKQYTIIPMILAEIYRALGHCKNGARYFQGCNLLLQAWFKEHLRKVKGLQEISQHTSANCLVGKRYNGPMFKKPSSSEKWLKLFENLKEESIQWMFTWFPSPDFITKSARGPYVILMGLRGFQPYLPSRVMRQAGRKQIVPLMPDTSKDQVDYVEDIVPRVKNIGDSWRGKQVMESGTVARDRYNAGCEPNYLSWLHSSLKGNVVVGPYKGNIIRD